MIWRLIERSFPFGQPCVTRFGTVSTLWWLLMTIVYQSMAVPFSEQFICYSSFACFEVLQLWQKLFLLLLVEDFLQEYRCELICFLIRRYLMSRFCLLQRLSKSSSLIGIYFVYQIDSVIWVYKDLRYWRVLISRFKFCRLKYLWICTNWVFSSIM